MTARFSRLVLLSVILLAAAVAAAQSRGKAVGTQSGFPELKPQLGNPAPPIHAADWVKGAPVSIAANKGTTVTVVEFWATWCGPCRTSIPHLTELRRKYAPKGVEIVGISDETSSTVSRYVEQMGEQMDYPVATDPSRATARGYMEAFGARGIPHAFVVDRDGAIVWHGHPMAGLEKVLDQVLDGSYDLAAARRIDNVTRMLPLYTRLASSPGTAVQARELGGRIFEDGKSDPAFLARFAIEILKPGGAVEPDTGLALRAAEAAFRVGPSLMSGVAYARALEASGRLADAIRVQKQAVERAPDERTRRILEGMLAQLERKTASDSGTSVSAGTEPNTTSPVSRTPAK